MPNWKTPGAHEKLLAAIVASLDGKSLNYKAIAEYFGEGATYSAVENQFRPIRKVATQMKEAAESGTSLPATPTGSFKASGKPGPKGKSKEPGRSPMGGRISKKKLVVAKKITNMDGNDESMSNEIARGFGDGVQSREVSDEDIKINLEASNDDDLYEA